MILHKHKCIFIHVPKTGGMSVCKALNVKNRMHKKASVFTGKHSKHYFKFAFIRNPWDRFVSAYKYLKKGGEPNVVDQRDNLKYIKGMEFIEFTEQCIEAVNGQTHFKPQHTWLDVPGITLGRFENFQNDFNIACDKIGIPRKLLPHDNKTSHKHYTEYYDTTSRDLVGMYYKKDIELFNYTFT